MRYLICQSYNNRAVYSMPRSNLQANYRRQNAACGGAKQTFGTPTFYVRSPKCLRIFPARLMATIKPFAALRPKPELATQICELPYDVMSSEEAQIGRAHV